MIPFGKARIVKAGDDITLVTFGALVERSLRAARRSYGLSVEVIDLRSLAPYDWPAIEASVRKTGKALVVRGRSHSLRRRDRREDLRRAVRAARRPGAPGRGQGHLGRLEPGLEMTAAGGRRWPPSNRWRY
jgi:hypothetical protein